MTPLRGPADILPRAAERFHDKPALITTQRNLSYHELDCLSAAVATSLQQRGISPGEVVSLYGYNSWQWVVAYHGALRAGAVVNPVNAMLSGPELSFVLNNCEAKALFAGSTQTALAAAMCSEVPTLQSVVALTDENTSETEGFTSLIEQGRRGHPVVVPLDPDALCAIAYTSGTTGHPKGAMQSHRSILLNCVWTATMHNRNASDVVATALPASHVYGNVAINSTFVAGGTVVLMERFDAAETLRAIDAQRATMFEGVPTMYSMLMAEPSLADADLSSLRRSTVGGQTLSRDLIERWEARTQVPLLELWGMTELSGLGTTHSPHSPAVPGSIGVPLPGVEMKVVAVDDPAREVPVETLGELVVRAPLVMMGYYRNDAATAEVLDDRGWLRTGDVGYRDRDGYYHLVDRLNDLIVSAGYNIYPAEVERVISRHPDVLMVGVGKRPDPVRSEIAVAFVVAKPGTALTAQALIDFCTPQLAAYKRPRDFVFVDALPLTASGKLLRRQLAALDPRSTLS